VPVEGGIAMHKTPEITRLIHDNLWIVVSFAMSREAVLDTMNTKLVGEWKYLNKYMFEYAEIRADRALLEMATQLRVLDDEEGFSDYLKQVGAHPLGTVTQGDGTKTDLHFRDMTNKVLHGSAFGWVFSDPRNPQIVIESRDQNRWRSAEIRLLSLMAFVGGIMF
jgi:hypothetical protein